MSHRDTYRSARLQREAAEAIRDKRLIALRDAEARVREAPQGTDEHGRARRAVMDARREALRAIDRVSDLIADEAIAAGEMPSHAVEAAS